MAMRLGTSKRLLTRYSNKLETIVAHFKTEKLEMLTATQDEDTLADNLRQLNEGVEAITAFTEKIEKLLREYATDVSSLQGLDEQELSSFEEYSTKAEEVLTSAFDYLVLLQSRRQAYTVCMSRAREASNTRPQEAERATSQAQPRLGSELPALPIPIFRGNIWEWDNFWELFNANIHSQQLPELYKFNYLKNAMRGEAYQAIEKFQVTSENYTKAVEFLLHKYGDKQVLITRPLDRLEKASLKSPSLRDQRALFEELQVIVAQLAQKGEQVDSQWCIRKMLSKFPLAVQRKVLLKRNALSPEDAPRMDPLLKSLEEVISDEEMISLYIEKREKDEKARPQFMRKDPPRQHNRSCMYCGKDHKSFDCTKYKTPQERSKYLREQKLCLICASAQHQTSQCKKRLCFKCQGPHHTSCCFREFQSTATHERKVGPNNKRPKEEPKKGKPQHEVHLVAEEPETKETAILQVNTTPQASEDTFLPTGELTVLDPRSNTLRKIAVLLDTGAEISFIDSALAEQLQLPTIKTTKLRLHTFGSQQVAAKDCRKVMLNVWDEEGQQCSLTLLTHDILTKAFTLPELQDEDVQFIKSQGLWVNRSRQSVKPQILLGADQLWSFVRADTSHIRLPSGLFLLSTRMGYLVTGQATGLPNVEEDRWNGYWSLEAQVNTVETVTDEEKASEQELWENFWKLDAAGTEEFGIPEKTQQAIVDKQVWDEFKRTIERRQDGYYVRLPWKNPQLDLPDNKAIAYRRLCSLWNSLQKDEKLLDQYNDIFQEQLHLNILEEVKRDSPQGARIHYIPHQAVITPHKSTTKLRIVYDASAHYKGSPSLNDVLHRGPVILPLLYGILLRFRIGHIALISDVEKAFLQVRLHEDDRDATRCLWLKNHKQEPTLSNIRTLRFTRVTFGLMPSPFLLAATTHYHLDQYKDSKLVSEMKENLYVDNLILCTDHAKDAIRMYQTTKDMFRELSMNLREFVSNDRETMQAIACKDKATELSPKVLGIKWNPVIDSLQIGCVMKSRSATTKRSVASTIASIYDPIGYLTPLLHKSKVFLRFLWQQNFDWDTILPENLTTEWEQIIQDVDGFEKSISRCLCSKGTEHDVIAFADASSEAIATCVYLRSDNKANLLIAKGKLPTIKSSVTIPKMELNAATLAMRVANAAITQLQSVIKIKQVVVVSDSEIALQWIKSKPQNGVGRMITSRLNEIGKIIENMEKSGCQVWFAHVASSQDPADCATRGLSKTELLNHFWWTGPLFLRDSPKQWKGITLFRQKTSGEYENEVTTATSMSILHSKDPDPLARLKKYPLRTVKRVMAYLLRYIRISVAKANKKRIHTIALSSWMQPEMIHGNYELSGPEITVATKALIKQHQRLITPEMIRAMRHLNIRTDKENLLRCYGRLGKSELHQNARQPLLILQNTWLAESIIRESHNKGHASINHTMSLVRENYWIPKLRAQVTRLIRRCVFCQKFNNLPFKYPEQSDLPKERVQRARPFEHVGLDYFGPLNVALSDGSKGKCYGCIITCMVTRLIHLDIAQDLSTKAFLLLLRRFFGRRGVPRTITSDNAPTFLLGETILRESYEAAKNDPSVLKELSDKEIVWKHITPYAPWQGGFYERLIKSVKLSLHKTLGNQTLAVDELTTVIVEIEAMLNTRPLLYMETDNPIEIALRPIDFLQNEIEMTYPVSPPAEEMEDPSYATSDEIALLRTKKQTIEALHSSCKAVEKFWQVWHTHYLTSLREKHQREVGNKRGSSYKPKNGDIVMIADPVQPRQAWKLGRISELVTNSDGITREAVIILPSHHKIRRPVNLLVPLELEDYCSDIDVPVSDDTRNTTTTKETSHPYNLRPNRKKNYASTTLDTSVLFITIMGLLLGGQGIHGKKVNQDSKTSRLMICLPGGIELISEIQVPYQVCVENFCKTVEKPRYNETIKFPPEIILHEHKVQWKLSNNKAIEILETTCPSAPFCDSIDCFFCASLIFNPECWPVGAIVALALAIYLLITGCYALLYIPLVIGKPIRVLVYSIFVILQYLLKCCKRKHREERRNRRRSLELAHLLAAIMIIQTIQMVGGCQTVDIISHSSTLCTKSEGGQVCNVQLSEILKLSPRGLLQINEKSDDNSSDSSIMEKFTPHVRKGHRLLY